MNEEPRLKTLIIKMTQALEGQQQIINKHEQAIGLLLKEVKALKTAAEQKPKIWTP